MQADERVWSWLRLLVGLKVNKLWPWLGCRVIWGWRRGSEVWNENTQSMCAACGATRGRRHACNAY